MADHALDRPSEAAAPEDRVAVGFVGPIGVQGFSFLRYVDELSDAFGSRPGFEVRHLARPAAPRWERRPSQFRLRRIAGRLRHRFRRRPPRQPPAGIGAFEADVYHFVAPGDAWLIPELPNHPSVVTVHDLLSGSDWRVRDGALPRPTLSRGGRYLESLAMAAHLVCVSESTRSEVLEYVDIDPSRVSAIPNGLDPRFKPLEDARVAAARDRLPTARWRVFHLSSSDKDRKNIETTLRVLRRLRDDGLDVRLVRAGAYLSAAQARLANELGVAELVDDLGRVDDDGVLELYNVADVLLFPSLYEGFGLPPLEAMACGMPVVASDIGAAREVVGDAGLLAAPLDADGLANHIASVLTNERLAAELRTRGFERVTHFTWESVADRFEALYRSLAEA